MRQLEVIKVNTKPGVSAAMVGISVSLSKNPEKSAGKSGKIPKRHKSGNATIPAEGGGLCVVYTCRWHQLHSCGLPLPSLSPGNPRAKELLAMGLGPLQCTVL
uniref:Uncharacterized protein n=1 Tax=Eutreptiella gymnastica TaxID=73025 RepID=A0A7S1N882_9EUGL|mmetsp:Transcript_13746/g.24528  ORF Transcript_13746/g.24528 Transcript_13746/m.24528 type:complete len:103 (+) Transcript_13746:861-1169(+)